MKPNLFLTTTQSDLDKIQHDVTLREEQIMYVNKNYYQITQMNHFFNSTNFSISALIPPILTSLI